MCARPCLAQFCEGVGEGDSKSSPKVVWNGKSLIKRLAIRLQNEMRRCSDLDGQEPRREVGAICGDVLENSFGNQWPEAAELRKIARITSTQSQSTHIPILHLPNLLDPTNSPLFDSEKPHDTIFEDQ
jgi:hypothetical protein